MTDVLLSTDKATLESDGVAKSIYDQAMGTSQMLTAMQERLTLLDRDAEVALYGQELNPKTYAIAKADMLIRGGNPDNMQLGNTLTDDRFAGFNFDYCISNPPFGIDWKSDYDTVKKEHDRGEAGRFVPGLPKRSDGQLLFMLNGLSKLKETGRMAIIHDGSSLFSGAAGSGESEIRRYVLENDWLESIIQLPNDVFYNTGITTYIWVFDKDKETHRKGKVQLIDASNMYESRRKNIGSKRVDITEECRNVLVQAYGEFQNKEYRLGERMAESKVFDNLDFGFNKVTIEGPLKDEEGNLVLKNKKVQPDTSLRDTEDIPLTEDIDTYFEREIKPFNPGAWIDKAKTKVAYEIPFTRLFYKYVAPESTEDLALKIKALEESIVRSFEQLSGQDVKVDD